MVDPFMFDTVFYYEVLKIPYVLEGIVLKYFVGFSVIQCGYNMNIVVLMNGIVRM